MVQDNSQFEQLDRTKFGMLHVKAILVAGIGFFCDAYDLFIINLVVPMIGYVYYSGKVDALDSTFLKGAAVVGTFLGQLVFGILGDVWGRKSVYGVSLALMLVSAICSSLAADTVRGINAITMLCIWRFILGIGIGGDYPLSAVITSEYATVKTRGMMMAAVFSMQGLGQVTAGVVALVVLRCFKSSIQEDVLNIDYVWRICLGLGCVPAVLGAYYRAKLPETPRFTAHVKGDANQARKDMLQVLSPSSPSSPSSPMDASPLLIAANTYEHVPAPQKANFADFCAHYRKFQNLKVLIGCAGAWFMLDVAFYGLGLNQSIVLEAIGFAKKHDPYENLFSIAVGNCIINLMGSVPGYWMTVALVERWGRKTIQIMGFGVLTVLFAVLSLAIKGKAIGLFIFLYCIGQFFFNFGPNSTTFIIPGEAFPTRYRSTSHGICAASGKLGAMVSSFGFTYMVSNDNPDPGVKMLLGVFSIFMLAGLLLSFLIKETKGLSLEEISQEGEAISKQVQNSPLSRNNVILSTV